MKKSKLTTTICTVLAGIMVFTYTAFAYDDAAAQEYADKYVFDHNSDYRYFTSRNCSNFVSQCMLAGGVKMDKQWWYEPATGVSSIGNLGDTWSNAWAVADDLKNYVKTDLGALRLAHKWMKYDEIDNYGKEVFGYVNDSNNISGRGIEIVFYDWQDDGKIDHSAIIVGTNDSYDETGYGDLVNCNSKDRQHTVWHLDEHNDYRETTAIYAFRLVD